MGGRGRRWTGARGEGGGGRGEVDWVGRARGEGVIVVLWGLLPGQPLPQLSGVSRQDIKNKLQEMSSM